MDPALAVSACSFLVAVFALSQASRALGVSHATIETEIARDIRQAEMGLEDLYERHGELLSMSANDVPLDQLREYERLVKVGTSRSERYLNALDGACQRYLDKKIDRVRFKKTWQREFRLSIESEPFKSILHDGHFNALMEVYREWENPERQ